MADAEPALLPPPALAAPAPETAPVVALALEPAVVASAPGVEQQENFHFYMSLLGFGSVGWVPRFCRFACLLVSLPSVFMSSLLFYAVYSVYCSPFSALVLQAVSLFDLPFSIAVYGLVACSALPFCFLSAWLVLLILCY